MATHTFDKLISKAVMKLAMTSSLATTAAVSELRYARAEYVIRVLWSPLNIRNFIKNRCASSDSPGQHDLAVMIALFNSLTPEKQLQFIGEYSRRNVVISASGRYIAVQNAWPFPTILHPHQEP